MKTRHDIIIIGAGAGGLVVASVAAQLGLDVVLIEKQAQMGGDCLHYGCIPSKALLHVASVANTLKQASSYGFQAIKPEIDILDVNAVVKKAIDDIQHHDSHERFREMGCQLITGEAVFCDNNTIVVNQEKLSAKRFVIATGSKPFIPEIPGLANVDYLTNEQMYSLPTLPKSLVILGGGPIGVEMAQAYSRLGSQVTLIEQQNRILPRSDVEASEVLRGCLENEGVTVITSAEITHAEQQQDGVCVSIKGTEDVVAEKVLVAIGRRALVNKLGLDVAGVDYTEYGIAVNQKMQTSNKHIYACGDVTGKMMLTHVAELQAGIVLANMVFKVPKKIDYQVVPTVVYTEPECAQVGLTVEQTTNLKNIEIHRFEYANLDRAVSESTSVGYAKLIVQKGRIVGADIVGARAGDVIHELALAIQEKMKVSKITSLVHAYPSYAQLNKRLAGQYFTSRIFSSSSRHLVGFLFKWFS